MQTDNNKKEPSKSKKEADKEDQNDDFLTNGLDDNIEEKKEKK